MAMEQQSGIVADGVYNAFRTNGAPTYYAEDHTPWHADILESGFIFAMCILALAFYVMLPGVHGKDRFFMFIWVTCSVLVGGLILLVNYGYEWETSTIHTATKYKAGEGRDIHATVGLHVGLRGVNITLKGEPEGQLNETINYNEHFGWSWQQGRLGFGPFSSDFNQEYRAAQFRGVPLPILWIAEYFTFDGEGIRWGRFYRMSGLYANMCLWAALPLWILANITVFVLLRYGAYFSILTGLSMVTANIIKHTIRNPNELKIPFENMMIFPEYGISFWLCLGTGCFCILVGLIVLLLDLRCPSLIAKFFSADVIQDDRLLEREGSAVSQSSVNTTTTTSTDLTEIVEIDGNGDRVQTRGKRPPGAPKTGSNGHADAGICAISGYNLDDVFGENDTADTLWEDMDPTDDEYESDTDEDKKKIQPVRRNATQGFISRFQAKRRVSSVNPRNRGRNSVSPTPANVRTTRFIQQKAWRI